MKRYLLFVIAFVCAHIGAWADVSVSGENNATVVSSTASDEWFPYNTVWQVLGNTTFTGDFSKVNWSDAAGKIYTLNQNDDLRFDFGNAANVNMNDFLSYVCGKDDNTKTRITKFVLPNGSSLPEDVSPYNQGGNLKYIYVTGTDGVASVFLTSKVTAGNDLSAEFTESAVNSIKENGINLSGDDSSIAIVKDYLINTLGVPSEKIKEAFNGKADVTGGSVNADCDDIISANGIEATDIKNLTVTAGKLTKDDVDYINNTLTGLQSIDLSAATVTSNLTSQLLVSSFASSITLGSNNISALQYGENMVLDMSKIADDVTSGSIADGLTKTNYIIDGNTLIVTGYVNDETVTKINNILAAKPNITKLDVSRAKNEGSVYTIRENTQLTTVSLPSSGNVIYDGDAIQLVDGVLEVSIGDGGQYASLEAMYTDLGDVLDEVEHLKITGTIPDMDKMMTSTDYQSGAICSLGGHENIKTLDLSKVTNTNFSDINCNNNCPTAILLPEGTDLTDSNLKAKNANFFAQDSEKEAQLNVLVNNADGPNNGTALANGAYFADQLGSTILKVYNGKSASGGAGAPALTAYKEYSTVSIVDLTSAQSNTNTTYNTEEKQEEAKDELSTFKTVLSPVDSNKKQLVIDGPLTNDVLEAISSIANGNITSIDFSGATVDGALDWSKLTGYNNVEYVMLPSGMEVNSLSTSSLPALKAAGNYDATAKAGAIHVYQEVTEGAVKKFSQTFPTINQYNETKAVFEDAEGLSLSGTLNANSLVLTNANNTTAVVGSSLKSVNLVTTEFAEGVTPKANMKVANNADVIAPVGITDTETLDSYAPAGSNAYSKNGATEMNVLYNNGTTFGNRSNDYLSGISTLKVHTTDPNGVSTTGNFDNVNVSELDFSNARLDNNNTNTIANTNVSSLVFNGSRGAYGAFSLDIKGCSNLNSADLMTADGQLKQVDATGLDHLTELLLQEASFSKTINKTSTTLQEGYVDITRTSGDYSNLSVYGDAEFNYNRIIPADANYEKEQGAAPAYKVNGCQITINMPDPRVEGEGLQNYLSEAIEKMSDPDKVICRLTINGPVTEADMKCDALKNAKAATIDMQKAQFADNSILANLKNNYVEHLATPYGCDDILDLKALGTNNPKLEVVGTYAATEEGEKDNTKFTAYSFKSNNMYDFIQDLFPEINDNVRYSSSDNSEHYPTSLTLGGHIGDQDLVKSNERVFKSDKIYDMDLTECDFDEDCDVNITSTLSYGGVENDHTGYFEQGAQLTCTSTNAMYYLSHYTPKNLILPKYDTEIPPCTFNSNTKSVLLENITFPEGSHYTKIGFEAFYKSGLEQFKMPGSVTEVGEGAFGSMTNMTDFTMEACESTCVFREKTFSGSKNIKHVTLSEGVDDVSYMMFDACASLEEIRIPNSCTHIDSYAFNLCFSLHSLTIPENVETMGRGVINLSGVTDIYLLAESEEKVPQIYAVPNEGSSYVGTFSDQNINGNSTDPRNGTREHSDLCHTGWEDGLKWYQEELSGSAGLGTGNCMTLIHFPDNMRDFYDGYPDPDLWKDKVKDPDPQILPEKIKRMNDETDGHKWISDGYGYGSKEYDAQYGGNKGNSDVSLITGCDHTHACTICGGGSTCPETCEKCEEIRAWPVQSDYAVRRAAGAVGSNDGEIRTAEAWRQFPLMTGVKGENKLIVKKEYDDTWYTMCFPWHLTDQQLFEAFNQKCEIAELVGVEMLQSGTTTDAEGNEEVGYNLVFHFDKVAKTYYMDDEDNFYKRELETTRSVTYNGVTIDKNYYKYTLLTKKDGEETTTVITDPYPYDEENHSAEDGERHVKYLSIQNIIPLAGHPYMIHPSVGAAPGKPTTCQFVAVERKYFGPDAEDQTWSPEKQKVTVPITTNTKADWDAINGSATEKPEIVPFVSPKTNKGGNYTFIGNVEDDFNAEEMTLDVNKKIAMPIDEHQVIYYLGVASGGVYPKYYRKTQAGNGKWSAYSAIIVPDADAYNGVETLSSYVEYFEKEAGAKASNVMFGEWEMVSPTAIDEIIADAEQKGEKVQKAHLNVVYSVNGQVVRTGTNSLEGLPSGMYIVNGKKYMVK